MFDGTRCPGATSPTRDDYTGEWMPMGFCRQNDPASLRTCNAGKPVGDSSAYDCKEPSGTMDKMYNAFSHKCGCNWGYNEKLCTFDPSGNVYPRPCIPVDSRCGDYCAVVSDDRLTECCARPPGVVADPGQSKSCT